MAGSQPTESHLGLKLLLGASLAVVIGLAIGALILPGETAEEDTAAEHMSGVSQRVYPSSLVGVLEQPVEQQWALPAAVAVVGDAFFVVDAGNGRILKLNESGRVLASFDSDSYAGQDVQHPMAIASDGSRLFVANSLSAEILVLDLSGRLQKVLSLRPIAADEQAPRPIGVAVASDGGIVVSDADNHRVVRLDENGGVVWSAGTGTRAGGSEGFNVPGALAIDEAGSIYVVDTLNGRVVKLSRGGAFVAEFGRLGDTTGTLSRPKGVAVDEEGRVFVSDGLMTAVQVFAADGGYLGFIGRQDPADPASTSLFRAPAGLSLAGTRLYVMDRFVGLVTLELFGPSPPEVDVVDESG